MRTLTMNETEEVSGGNPGEKDLLITYPTRKANDTDASYQARLDGYAACEALGAGVEAAAKASGISAAKTLAKEVAPACKVAVDNQVNAAFRTQMTEDKTGI